VYYTATNRADRRAESRARRLRQRHAPARKQQRGQTLVIFALSVTVLLGLASLAIDVMRAYDLYAREERAAEAGALAGVIYMPCSYDSNGPASSAATCSATTSPDGLTARQRALQEVQKNSFGTSLTVASMPDPCTGGNTSAEVTVCAAAGRTNALQVTISEPITSFFLFTSISGNSAQSFMVTATAGAGYLSSNVLGNDPTSANSNAWGDGGSKNPKFWVPTINGPAEFKETGDPYVYCEEGPSNGPMSSAQYPNIGYQGADENLYQTATPSPLYNLGNSGQSTNHPQYSSGPHCGNPGSAQAINGGNPNQQPTGFDGPATAGTVHDGASNYAIYIPPTSAGTGATGQADVWIWNPGFDPSDPSNSCQGAQQQDRFPLDTTCNMYYQNYGLVAGTTNAMIKLNSITPNPATNTTGPQYAYLDDPRLYFTMTYSVYLTTGTSPGTQLALTKAYPPRDMISNDLARHGCTTTAYDLSDSSYYNTPNTITSGKGCVTNTLQGAWDDLGTLSKSGLYRLAVEASPYQLPTGNPNPACSTQNAICGWGRHMYAILVCAPAGPGVVPTNDTCPNGSALAKISAWNNMDMYINFPTAGPQDDTVPLAYISKDFAGHTIEIGLFDPGDAHTHGNSNWFIIVPPNCTVNPNGTPLPYGNGDGAGHTQAVWVRTAPYPVTPPNAPTCGQDQTSMYTSISNGSQAPSDCIYNGLWIWTRITLPSNYTAGEWYMDEHTSGGKDFDQFAIAFRLDDPSPVHIIF
jgi:Putative Flp pilus-assembly TadE/G-like